MIAVAAIVAVLAAAGWLTAQVATGGWRRILIRFEWATIMRNVGLAQRRDRETAHKPGAGEKVSPTRQIEHLPRLWALWGRPVGPLTARVGATYRVWSAAGQTTAEVAAQAERIAASLHSQRVIIDIASPRRCRLTLLWRDPFTLPKPWAAAEHGKSTPAFDVRGKLISAPLMTSWGGSWLIGASAGSGKSAWTNALVADLVRQPAGTVHLLGVDLKRVELGPWSPAFVQVARDRAHAERLIRWCRQFVDIRMADLEAAGLRCVPEIPTAEWPFVALVIEELGALLSGKGSHIDELRQLLGELTMLGRAAGLVIVAAVQRPTTDLVPGQFRDNIPRRVLLRVPTLDHGQAVLGWRPTQADLDQLDTPGLALVDLPGRRPFLARSTFGTVDDVTAVAAAHATTRPNRRTAA
ncbi:MAG: hypothetical protein AB7W59_03295 [Acidimicrobiia bacterium]